MSSTPTPSPSIASAEMAIETHGLTKRFGERAAIDGVDLRVPRGSAFGFLGPNGAGKTTMMDIITGKTRPDTGTVLFEGSTDLTKLDEATIAELGIGRKFQKPTVFESHTVRDNLVLALKEIVLDYSPSTHLLKRAIEPQRHRATSAAAD